MSAKWSTSGLVVVGLVLALALGELGIRALDGVTPVMSRWPTPESEVKYQQLVHEGRNPDVVFFGSSFVESAVNPEEFDSGLDGYNLAMPFTTTETIEWWLREVVFETVHPRIVVVGVPVWTDLDDMGAGLVEALIAASRQADQYGDGLRLLGSRGVLGQMDRLLARERLIEGGVWTDFGHQTGYRDRATSRSSWERRASVEMGSVELNDLRRVIAVARAGSSFVVLMVEPLAASIAPEPEAIERYVSDLRMLAAESGVAFVEPPREFWDDELYVDGVHLNAEGTTAFSRFLDSELLALGPRVTAFADS